MKISNKLVLLAIASVVSTSVMPSMISTSAEELSNGKVATGRMPLQRRYELYSNAGAGIAEDVRVPENATTVERLEAAVREAKHLQAKIAKVQARIDTLEAQEKKLSTQKNTTFAKQLNKTRNLISKMKAKLADLKSTSSKLDTLAKTISKVINLHCTHMEAHHKKVTQAQEDLDEEKAKQESAMMTHMGRRQKTNQTLGVTVS